MKLFSNQRGIKRFQKMPEGFNAQCETLVRYEEKCLICYKSCFRKFALHSLQYCHAQFDLVFFFVLRFQKTSSHIPTEKMFTFAQSKDVVWFAAYTLNFYVEQCFNSLQLRTVQIRDQLPERTVEADESFDLHSVCKYCTLLHSISISNNDFVL